MATADITVDEGTTLNIATNTITEDAVTKHLGRSVINKSDGTEVDMAALVASASVLDDWDESDRAKTNPIVGQAGVAAGAGAVGATVQRVTLASDDPGVASLSVLDDWDSNDRAKVSPVAGQDGVAAGAGAVSATTQRATLASDDPAVVSLALLDDVVQTEDTAHSTGHKGIMPLAVRNDARGTLAGTDGDYAPPQLNADGDMRVDGSAVTQPVSAASLPLPTGAATAAKQPALGTAGTSSADVITVQGRAAMTPLLTDGSATTQPVSGTVAVTNADLTAIAASASVLDDWDESDRAKVNIVVGQAGVTAGAGAVAANTPRVTLASDDPGVASLSVLDDWDESDRAKVNLIAGQAGVTAGAGAVAANTPRTTLASDDPAVVALQLLDDAVFVDDAAFTPGTSKVVAIGLQADESSTDSVNEGDAGAPRMTLDRKTIVTVQPHTVGGLSIHKSLDLDESEEEIKGTPGQIYGWFIANLASTTRFVKFYNDTAANVVVGTTVPVMTLPIPGNSTDDVAANALGANGIEFTVAICAAATTGLADADTGAPAVNDVVVNLFYK